VKYTEIVVRVGRFQVMSMLQACRAEALGLKHDSALSWGLNRAIFFAAAKRGFAGRGRTKPTSEKKNPPPKETDNTFKVGDELGFVDMDRGKLYFTIGGETQKPDDFRRQIATRFGGESNFQKAWNEAKDIIRKYDKETLESGRRFFDEVYKPRRDSLASAWSNLQTMPRAKRPQRLRNRA
jgi:hypothetical protein